MTKINYKNPNSELNPYYEQVLQPGIYLFECWGAKGGGVNGGNGGYISGVVHLNKEQVFYVVVGSRGAMTSGGYNGGGDGGISHSYSYVNGYGGGGGTDVRLNQSDIYSRIIVAGGGGGASGYSDMAKGGHAGGIVGGNSIMEDGDKHCTDELAEGGSKASGVLWKGESSINKTISGLCGEEGNGGGGGGFYGGTSINREGNGSDAGGGGGSSCISGHPDCNIDSKHSAGITFTNITIKSGIESIISPEGKLVNGHNSDGYFRISQYVNKCICTNENSKIK